MKMASPVANHCAVIVIGAGIAGTAAAHALGNDGKRVLLIERDWSEPDRIVGELLQPGGIRALQDLGIPDVIDGIDGVDCHGYVVIKTDGTMVHLPYPTDKLPNRGRSLHHGRLVMNLRNAAQRAPNVTCIEGTATELIKDEDTDTTIGVRVKPKGADEPIAFYAPLTVVADGCASNFRKHFVPLEVKCKSYFVGLILEDCPLPSKYHGHVVLAKPSPILLYQIGSRETRILVDIPGKLPSTKTGEMLKYMKEVVGPQLPKAVQPSFEKALQEGRFRSMPNSWLPPTSNKSKGVVAQIHWTRKSLASVVNILANALYSLFSAGDDRALLELQDGCFSYFLLGGRCASTPVGLLAGLIHEPLTLIGHFFAVAFYATLCTWFKGPIYMFPVNFVWSFMVLYRACVVIFPLIFAELRV
eukprot:jgi/Hompol1/6228/HPOL_001339-RA